MMMDDDNVVCLLWCRRLIIIIILLLLCSSCMLVVFVALLLHHYDRNMNYMHSLSKYYTFHHPLPITLNVFPAAQFSCQRSTLNSDLKGREIKDGLLILFFFVV